jgi:hypothetical protein
MIPAANDRAAEKIIVFSLSAGLCIGLSKNDMGLYTNPAKCQRLTFGFKNGICIISFITPAVRTNAVRREARAQGVCALPIRFARFLPNRKAEE